MTTKSTMIANIKAAADATLSPVLRAGLGATGSHVKLPSGDTVETGRAWDPSPKAQEMIVEGIAKCIDDVYKAKINEVINQYNQLLADYNGSVVPSTANTVAVIP